MASRSMMRSVSAPAADLAPPRTVQLALESTPFKSSTTRRDLSTSFRGFKAAWSAIEQVQVLSASCRRLGERAGEVLMAVREKLVEIEQEETSQKGGKIVLERSYEFQGSKPGGEMAGKTIFKIQSTMLDLQAFASDHLAKSNASRLTLLVDDLAKTLSALSKLSNSLLACISTYSISTSTIMTSLWSEQDASDLAKDYAALPRLFQLSIILKGPVYERFTRERTDSPSTETPGQRRAAFVEWCLEQNPTLRPNRSGGGSGTSAPPVKNQSLQPSNGLGLGLPSSLTVGAGGVSMRRAVTQPLTFSAPITSSSPKVPLSDDPETPSDIESLPPVAPASVPGSEIDPSLPPSNPSSDNLPHPDPSSLGQVKPAESLLIDEPLPPNSADSSDYSVEIAAASSVQAAEKPDVPNDSLASHALDRSTSTVSSMAMTNSSSTGSLLFEPVLPSIQVGEVQADELVAETEEGEHPAVLQEKKMDGELEEETAREDEAEEGVEQDKIEIEEEKEEEKVTVEPISVVRESDPMERALTLESYPSTPVDINNSLLGLALDSPLPPSPQVDDLFSPSQRKTVSVIQSSPPPDPRQLLEPLPIADNEPSKLPPSPALPSSPSLLITSFDDNTDTDTLPPSPPPKPDRPFRVLSLDGGGLVGPIPQLLALKKELLDNSHDSTSPSHHFDLIVGTSSSALPALLLGQLGLSIDETLQICAQVSRRALGLEGPSTASSESSKQQSKPRRIGRWSRFFSRSSRSSRILPPPDRRTALDAALKQYTPSATAPLPLSRTPCRGAVLAYRKTATEHRAQECWLSVDSNLSLSEIVQASMSLPSNTTSPFVPSPTSFNPTSSALKYAQSLLSNYSTSHSRSIELASVSIGYSLSTIPLSVPPTTAKKSIGVSSRTRLEKLKELKQIGAGNSAAHESLSKKLLERGRGGGGGEDEEFYPVIDLKRIDLGLDSRELGWKDESELFENLKVQIFGGGKGSQPQQLPPPLSPRQHSTLNFSRLSPPGSPSSFVSQPPPLSPPSSTRSVSSSPRKRLNFFSSSNNNYNNTLRSISSSEIFSSPSFVSPSQSGEDEEEREGEEEEVLGCDGNDTEFNGRRRRERGRGLMLRSSTSMGELHRGSYSYSGGLGGRGEEW
ncbi:hypothetical protein JCM5350_007259 [Sporobolomyces pararoseus]